MKDELKTALHQARSHLAEAEQKMLELLHLLEEEGTNREFFIGLEEYARWKFHDLWGILLDALDALDTSEQAENCPAD